MPRVRDGYQNNNGASGIHDGSLDTQSRPHKAHLRHQHQSSGNNGGGASGNNGASSRRPLSPLAPPRLSAAAGPSRHIAAMGAHPPAVTSSPAHSQPNAAEAAPQPDLLPVAAPPVPQQPLDPLLGLRPTIVAPVPPSVAPSVQTQGLGSENTQCQSLMPQSSTVTSAGFHISDHQTQQQFIQVKGGSNGHALSLYANVGEALDGSVIVPSGGTSAVTSKSALDSKHTAASLIAAAAAQQQQQQQQQQVTSALMAATSVQKQQAAAAAATAAMSAWRQQQLALQQMQALQTLGIPPYGFFHGSNGGEALGHMALFV